MFLTAWQKGLRNRLSSTSPGRPVTKARPKSCRPRLEVLEDRCLLSYNIVDLGGFEPNAINNAGVVAGTIPANNHAALWQNGTIRDLGTLGGASSFAYDVNNLGQAVGIAQTSSGSQAFFWNSAQGMQGLGVVGYGYGVNDASQVVGSIFFNSFSAHAFFWDTAHGTKDLGTFGGTASWARAINKAGQVAGWVENRSNGTATGYGYVWDSSTGSFTQLGGLPGYTASRAYDINNAGQVIGYSGFFSPIGSLHLRVFSPRATCLWQNGVVTNLGMPSVRAINNNGQVVGGKYMWQNGTLTDLSTQIDPSLGWTFDINSALDINDAGQIVGQGTLNGQTHYFLMSPVSSAPVSTARMQSITAPTAASSLHISGPATLSAGWTFSITATAFDAGHAVSSADALALLASAGRRTEGNALGVFLPTRHASLDTTHTPAGIRSISSASHFRVLDQIFADLAGSQRADGLDENAVSA